MEKGLQILISSQFYYQFFHIYFVMFYIFRIYCFLHSVQPALRVFVRRARPARQSLEYAKFVLSATVESQL